MSVEVTWDAQSENVVLYRFSGAWDWQDFINASERSAELVQTLNGQRYDVIGSFLESPRLPSSSGSTHVYKMFQRRQPNTGLTVLVTRSALVRALIEILGKAHPETRHAFAVVSTLEEARARIAQARAEAAARE